MITKTLIIHNPIAGQKKNIKLREELKKWSSNETQYDYVETEYGGHAIEIAKKAISEGYTRIVAAGGDGTVNEIASTLVNTDVALGILPMGSGNGLARHNRISMNLKKAFQTIFAGKTVQIDTGVMNGNFFFCAAGIGFDALVSEKFANSKTRGLISYFLISLKEYFNYSSLMYSIDVDGKVINKKAFFITLANANQFGNHAYVAPQALIDDGKLDICVLQPFPWYKGFSLANRLFGKTIQKSKLYTSYIGKNVTISGSSPISFHTDGEVIKNTSNEVTVDIIPKSLHIICP